MESETLFDQERREGRRRFLKAAAGVLFLSECGRAGFRALLSPQDHAPEFPAPRTLSDLAYVIRSELGIPPFIIPKPPAIGRGTSIGTLTDLPAMVGNGLERAREEGVATIPEKTYGYLAEYGEEPLSDPSHVRCNNHAYDACRRFARYDMPMHLLSLAPPIRHFLSVDWHIMAFCPLADRRDGTRAILAFENGTPLFWQHGDLTAFAAWHEQDQPVDKRRWIPWKGIARFRERRYKVHRLMMHVGHAVNEADMKALMVDALSPGKMPMLAYMKDANGHLTV